MRYALLLLLTLMPSAHANLGESVADCVKRYGKPVGYSEANAKSPFGTLVFSAGGYTLLVFLLNDREVGARVSKSDKTAFTDSEMKTIMDAETPASWQAARGSDPESRQWLRADQATAFYDREKKMLIFAAPQMTDALHHSASSATALPAAVPALSPH